MRLSLAETALIEGALAEQIRNVTATLRMHRHLDAREDVAAYLAALQALKIRAEHRTARAIPAAAERRVEA